MKANVSNVMTGAKTAGTIGAVPPRFSMPFTISPKKQAEKGNFCPSHVSAFFKCYNKTQLRTHVALRHHNVSSHACAALHSM